MTKVSRGPAGGGGTFDSVLPLPGGVCGIEAGMISFWLPMIPGIVRYFRLRSTVREWRQVDREAARV